MEANIHVKKVVNLPTQSIAAMEVKRKAQALADPTISNSKKSKILKYGYRMAESEKRQLIITYFLDRIQSMIDNLPYLTRIWLVFDTNYLPDWGEQLTRRAAEQFGEIVFVEGSDEWGRNHKKLMEARNYGLRKHKYAQERK